MKWEEYQKQLKYNDKPGWEKTDIECPNCGEKIFRDATLVLTSIPPQFRYRCFNCDWTNVGY